VVVVVINMSENKQGKALFALTTAALALPGINNVAKAAEPTEKLEYQFSYYRENSGRMNATVQHISSTLSLSERFKIGINAIKDVISGASPIFNLPSSKNGEKPTQILSGASIRETRHEGNITGTYEFDTFDLGLTAKISNEHDYLSNSIGFNVNKYLNDKNTILSFGTSVSKDKIEPTGQTWKKDKNGHSYLFGITQNLTPKSLVQLNLGYSNYDGYLSDPYKKVFIKSLGLVNDKRPDKRQQWTINANYIHYLEANDASIHLNYRYYNDDWDINSHTFELTYNQTLKNSWEVIPNLRYYSQNSAKFYQAYFENPTNDGYYSSDYRLADYGAISGGIKFVKHINDNIKFDFAWNYYNSSDKYKIGSSNNISPEYLSFNLFSIGLHIGF
jgi:hypothetical protein